MKRSNLSYSVWGIFENKKKILLENIKNKINKKLKGPKFSIHLTISSCLRGEKSKIIDKLKLASKKSKKFFIETKNYGCKKKFFQSIFVKVKITKELKAQKKIIDKLLNLKKTSYDPHISLYYGNTSLSNKKKIISSLKNFEKKIKIVKICLVKNDENKLRWKITNKFSLL